MELDESLKKLLELQIFTQTPGFIEQPVAMSKAMARLSIYTGAVESKLAEYEKDYELKTAQELKVRLIDEHMKVTQAEREVDIETAELKGQIKYLTRLVSSAWRQIGVLQSRINHLVKQSEVTNI